MKQRRLLLTALGLGAFSFVASAVDWPQWRGPNRTGISQETGLLKEWPKNGPKLLWHLKDIGDGYATPVVVGGRVYALGNHGLENEFVQALSVEDGKTLWTTRLGNVGNPKQEPPYPKARSTPTIDGDVMYVLGSDGDLACVEISSGKIRWQKNLRSDFAGVPGRWAYAESPLVDGDAVIATPGGKEASIVAFNKKTGATIWKSVVPEGDPAGYSSVVPVQGGGRKQYVQFMDKGLVGVDAKTGQYLWRYNQTGKAAAANMPTPVVKDGYIYTAAQNIGGGLVNLKSTATGVEAEQVYFTRDLPNRSGGAILLGDTLFGTNGMGLVAADFLTGKIKWQAEGVGPGSTFYAENRLYVHGENGEMLLADASAEGYRERGRFTPPDMPKHAGGGGGGEKAWPYPVVANGRLFIRDLSTLWVYDVRAPK